MGDITTSRQTLRRAIGRKARMKFFQRYPPGSLNFTTSGDTNTSASSTEVFYCTSLTQIEGAWKGSYIWVNSTDSNRNEVERYIANFNAQQDGLYLEYPVTTDQVPTSDDTFELYEIWSPTFIHESINDAIRDSWRTFPDLQIDENLVIQENKQSYDISTLNSSRAPASVLQIFVERNITGKTGQITSVTDSDNFGDTNMDLSDVTASTASSSDWAVSIYEGTGKGQLFELSAADTATQIFTVAASATTNPDTTSKIRLWNKNEEDVNWYPLLPVKFDRYEHPNTMYVQGQASAFHGYRFRIIYIPQPLTLSADTDETSVPEFFVKHKALAAMHDSLVEDNRADSRRHMQIAENHDQIARDYALRHPRRLPDGTVWDEGTFYSGYGTEQNPLW